MAPSLDVSEVLTSPEFMDTVDVIRRSQVTNQFGEPVITSTKITISAVVTNAGPNDLKRLPEAQLFDSVISVITQFRLRGVSKDKTGASFQPDLVVWDGATYIVSTLDNYSRFGAGFMESLCTETDYVEQAAT